MKIDYRATDGKIEYFILHDGREFSEQLAIEHFRTNGHPREPMHIYAPFSRYQEMEGIAARIDSIFKAKEEIRKRGR